MDTPSDVAGCQTYLDSNFIKGALPKLKVLHQNMSFFEIPHLILTYSDYLACLYSGNGRAGYLVDMIPFFNACWNPNYSNTGAWLIYIYRNGLVHEYAPKTIKMNPTAILEWKCGPLEKLRAEHLDIKHVTQQGGIDYYEFCINIPQFIDDFEESVKKYIDLLASDATLFPRFQIGFSRFNNTVDFATMNHPAYITPAAKQWLQDKVTRCIKNGIIC